MTEFDSDVFDSVEVFCFRVVGKRDFVNETLFPCLVASLARDVVRVWLIRVAVIKR